MNDFKRSVFINLLDKNFFDERSCIQLPLIEESINESFVKKYRCYSKKINENYLITDNMQILKDKLKNDEMFEEIGMNVIDTSLDIFGYVQGHHIELTYWDRENLFDKNGCMTDFCVLPDASCIECVDKIFKYISSYNPYKSPNIITKTLIRRTFE